MCHGSYAMPCYAMPCYAMLCYAMLCLLVALAARPEGGRVRPARREAEPRRQRDHRRGGVTRWIAAGLRSDAECEGVPAARCEVSIF